MTRAHCSHTRSSSCWWRARRPGGARTRDGCASCWDRSHGIRCSPSSTLQRLVPLLGGRVLELAGTSAPAAFADAVAEQTEAARQAGGLMELTTLRVAAALETAGIANVPLKGPLLARSLHGDPGARFSRDIDVLVGREDLQRAAAALEPLGWRPERGAGEPVLHLALAHESGLPEVELHWRLHWYESEFAARALARAQPGPDGVRRLQDVDELTALLLYHARDGFAGLRHAIDAAAWWDAHDTADDRVLLAEVALEHPALARALSASATVLDQLVGIPADRLVPGASRPPVGGEASRHARQPPDARHPRADHRRDHAGRRPPRPRGPAPARSCDGACWWVATTCRPPRGAGRSPPLAPSTCCGSCAGCRSRWCAHGPAWTRPARVPAGASVCAAGRPMTSALRRGAACHRVGPRRRRCTSKDCPRMSGGHRARHCRIAADRLPGLRRTRQRRRRRHPARPPQVTADAGARTAATRVGARTSCTARRASAAAACARRARSVEVRSSGASRGGGGWNCPPSVSRPAGLHRWASKTPAVARARCARLRVTSSRAGPNPGAVAAHLHRPRSAQSRGSLRDVGIEAPYVQIRRCYSGPSSRARVRPNLLGLNIADPEDQYRGSGAAYSRRVLPPCGTLARDSRAGASPAPRSPRNDLILRACLVAEHVDTACEIFAGFRRCRRAPRLDRTVRRPRRTATVTHVVLPAAVAVPAAGRRLRPQCRDFQLSIGRGDWTVSTLDLSAELCRRQRAPPA